jgi:uncharacterized protein
MTPPIDGGLVVLTGASSGIGAEMARKLASRARTLVLVARREDRLRKLADELEGKGAAIEVRPCDLADVDAVAALIAALEADHGGADVLINNAGVGDIGLLETRSPDKLTAMLMVNCVGLTLLTRGLVPGMVKRSRGGVLNVSSGFGLTWMPGLAAYVGTKHYVTAFSDALRCELSGTGVVVTQLCPGPVATEFEEMAESPIDQEVPGLMMISAESCARHGLAGFGKGRAIVLPGLKHWLMMNSGRLVPRFLWRWVMVLIGRQLRQRAPTAA